MTHQKLLSKKFTCAIACYMRSDKEETARKRQLRFVPFMEKMPWVSEFASSVLAGSETTTSIWRTTSAREGPANWYWPISNSTGWDRRQSARELAEKLSVGLSTIARRLGGNEEDPESGQMDSLTNRPRKTRKSTCVTLLERQQKETFYPTL